jgi:hypothetical protein
VVLLVSDGATKAFIDNFTKAMIPELLPTGVVMEVRSLRLFETNRPMSMLLRAEPRSRQRALSGQPNAAELGLPGRARLRGLLSGPLWSWRGAVRLSLFVLLVVVH